MQLHSLREVPPRKASHGHDDRRDHPRRRRRQHGSSTWRRRRRHWKNGVTTGRVGGRRRHVQAGRQNVLIVVIARNGRFGFDNVKVQQHVARCLGKVEMPGKFFLVVGVGMRDTTNLT